MTDKGPEQSSITDFGGENTSGQPHSEPEENDTLPSADKPSELYDWLQDHELPAVPKIEERLPSLIQKVKDNGQKIWSSSNCINHFLENTSTQLNCPEIVTLLDEDSVKTRPVIDHVLRIYPLDKPSLEYSLDTEFTDELQYSDRMRAYQALSRLPPRESVYTCLKQASKELEGVGMSNSGSHNIRFFETYAMRCFKLYLQYPEEAPTDLAYEVLEEEVWQAVRIVAADTDRAFSAGIVTPLIEKLDGASVPSRFPQGRILPRLLNWYINTENKEKRRDGGQLIQVIIDAGISLPPNFDIEEVGNQFDRDLRSNPLAPKQTVALLAVLPNEVLKFIQTEEYISWIDSVADGSTMPSSDEPQSHQLVAFLRILKHSIQAGYCTPSKRLVSLMTLVARRTDGEERQSACSVLVETGKVNHSLVAEELPTILDDITAIESSDGLEDYAEILYALDTYPEPQPLRELYNSTDPEIERTAKQIVRRLRRNFRDSDPCLHPGEYSGSLQDIEEQYVIKYNSKPGYWQEVNYPPVDQQLLSQIGEAASTGENTQFILPYHNPRAFGTVLVGMALLLLVADTSPRVAVYSPGTRSRWGTKQDLRKIYRKFGIDTISGPTAQVTPLPDLIPLARVSDGDIEIDTTSTTVADEGGEIVLTRDRDELLSVDPDVIFCNFVPSISYSDGKCIEAIRGSPPPVETAIQPEKDDNSGEKASNEVEATVIEFYGLFTQHEVDDRLHWTGPPQSVPSGETPCSELSKETISPSQNIVPAEFISHQKQSRALENQSQKIRVHEVATRDEINRGFSQLWEILRQLDDSSDNERAVLNRLTRIKRDLERLPVSIDVHDEWIREQRSEGKRYLPATYRERRKALAELGDKYPLLDERIHDAVEVITQIRKALTEGNPLFQGLLHLLDEVIKDGEQIAILAPKKSLEDFLKQQLYARTNFDEETYKKHIRIVDSDSLRDELDTNVDRLIRFGVGEFSTAIYYHHPAVERVDVIAHQGTAPQRRINGLLEESTPFFPESTGFGIKDPEISHNSINIGETPAEHTEQSPFKDSEQTFENTLFRAYFREDTETTHQDRRKRTSTRYRLRFTDGTTTEVIDTHPLVVKSQQHLASTGEYVLQRVSATEPGDTVVVIDEDTRNALWEDFLRRHYTADDSDDKVNTVLEAASLWYNAINNALDQISEPDDPRRTKAREVYEMIKEEVPASRAAVTEWVRSVQQAESPGELVFRREYVLGPENPESVRVIASHFGSDDFQATPDKIYEWLDSARKTHATHGHEFWSTIQDRACDGSLFDEPGVTQRTVKEITEVS